MWDFLVDQRLQLLYQGYQHLSLVVQAVALATLLALVVAVLVTRVPALDPVANAISAIGLTVPSFALLGLFLPIFGLGVGTSFAAVTFYAILPVLRNAVVGLESVDTTLLESAQGMGMSAVTRLLRIQLQRLLKRRAGSYGHQVQVGCDPGRPAEARQINREPVAQIDACSRPAAQPFA